MRGISSRVRRTLSSEPTRDGKTHLAIGIAVRACQAGRRAAFATAAEFADACRQAGVPCSMSAVGGSADNPLAEAFNASLKRETFQGSGHWSTANQARPGGVREQTTRERRRTVHDLLGQGVGLLERARRLGLALKTVKRYARSPESTAPRATGLLLTLGVQGGELLAEPALADLAGRLASDGRSRRPARRP